MESEISRVGPGPAARETRLEKLERRKDPLALALLFLVTMAVYVPALARTVTFSDAGDFLMGLESVGNVHGPGYPLYLMTCKLFSWLIPFGSLAFRASLYSALFASLTVCLIYLVVHRMAGVRSAAVLAGLAYAFSYTFWYQSVIPETYSLNAFFIALLILLALRWEKSLRGGDVDRADNTLCLFALALGLAMTNHFSIIFLLPAFMFFAIDTDWRNALAPRNLARMAGFFALGLLPYLYQPVAAFRGPAYNYGDPSTPLGWYRHMTVHYQRSGLLGYPYRLLPSRFFRYLGTVSTEFPYFWWVGAVGLYATFRKREKKYALFLALLFLLALVPVMTYRQLESVLRAHFYYESYLVFSIWIGFGAAWFARAARRWSENSDAVVRKAATSFVALLMALCVLAGFIPHRGKVDKSGYRYARDMARIMLESVQPDAVLLVADDNVIFPVMCLQVTERLRTDVRVVSVTSAGAPGFQGRNLLDHTPAGYAAGDRDRYEQLVERNYDRLPVYTTLTNRAGYSWGVNWLGHVSRLYPPGRPAPPDVDNTARRTPGAGDPGFKDSDARWAVLFPRALQASSLFAAKRFSEAAAIYRRSIRLFEKDMYVPTLYGCATCSEMYYLLGEIQQYREEYEAIVRTLPGARRLNPDFVSPALARAYAKLDRPADAIAEFGRILTRRTDDAESWTDLGEVYLGLGDYRSAADSLEKAVASGPDNARAHLAYGQALYLLGNIEGARKEFVRAVRLDPRGCPGATAGQYLERMPGARK